MKKYILILFSFIIVVQSSYGIDHKNYLKNYKKRCDSILSYYASLPFQRNAMCAMSKIALKKDIPTALQIIDTLAIKPTGDMFWFYPMVTLYCSAKDELPAESKDRIRNAFKEYTPNRGDTENHWLMYYVSLYLISQEFPKDEGSTWFNGRSSRENFKDADSYLKEWMRITTSIGQGEFDSPNYGDLYATSLVILYQFSKDPVMKKKAEIMLDWVLADFFVDYFDGIYSGANSRIYARNVLVKRDDQMCRLGTFLLGDKPLFDKDHDSKYLTEKSVIWALSGYRIPDYILNIAFDRKAPYENREMKRSRNRIRYYQEKNPKVAKYGFVTDEYAMGSIRINQTEQILQHSWNLNWKEEKRGEITTLFSVQPYYSDYDMASLFPSSRKGIIADIAGVKVDYDKEDKLVGASPAERLFQYKSCLIGLYDLSSKDIKYKHYDLIIPKSIKEKTADPSGWIFCKGNNVYIAIFPVKPYTQMEDSLIYRFRSSDLINGFILQVKGSKEISSYDEFQKKVNSIRPDLSDFDKRHHVSFVDLDGNKIEYGFNEKGKVNGVEDNPENYKLFDNPFMQSDINSELMKIKYKGKTFILDSKNAKIYEK
jgi:hypothetical protein